ncbi:MAG: bifunctional 4-hydroxy-3-methylbut-2-enyl diphosphate reductase/30S ribosomal protein S1 [Eubacteriales bacterium]
MQIRVAKTAGFCFGVDRAVNLIYSLLEQGRTVYTLGPIIHNPQVIEDLKQRGVVIIEHPEEAPEGVTVVVRTHGVADAVMNEFACAGVELCDATCPFVKKIHNIVSEKSTEDIPVLIAGDENHPEVCGIRGYCRGRVFTFKDAAELKEILYLHPEYLKNEIIIVAQTTFSIKEWQNCAEIINLLCTNAILFDTICNATHDRQTEAIELSLVSDAVLIIGGRQSSNTAKLKSVCEANCKTYLIESAEELHQIDFLGFNSIGVTAGASTPAGIIKEVLETMSEILNDQPIENEETAAQLEEQEVLEVVAPEEPVTEEVKEMEAPAEEVSVKEVAPAEEVAIEAEPKSIEEIAFSEALEENLKNMSTDQKVIGVVMGISPTEIQVDIGRKHAGYIPLDEYSADPTCNPKAELKIGDKIDLIIMKTNDQEGTVMLSKLRCDAMQSWFEIIDAENTDKVFEGLVTEVIRGGVLVVTSGVKVFIPASLATASRNEPLEDLLHKKVKFLIIEVNKQRKRAVGSIRAVLKSGNNDVTDAFWSQVAVDQVYKGKVKSMTTYGAFVDIGGVDGMVHISELSWKRIKHPSDILNLGDEIEVYIKALDPEKRKISLGYKKADDSPWELLRRDYPVGTVIDSEIVGMTTFGAFAKVIPGVDGLIHISQIADRHIAKPQDELKIGEAVKVKITGIDFDKHRVSLSIRALIEPIEGEATEVNEAAAVEEVAVIEEVAQIEEVAPIEEVAVVEETAAAEEVAPVEEAPKKKPRAKKVADAEPVAEAEVAAKTETDE